MTAPKIDPLFGRVFGTVMTLPDEWRALAASRRRLTPVDPGADVLDHCADALARRLAEVSAATERLTPEQFAALPHVRTTPQTVRAWCARGELPGVVQTARGWLIPRDAQRVRGRRARRAAA